MYNVTPPHIDKCFKTFKNFTHPRSVNKFKLFKHAFTKRLLRIEINDFFSLSRFAHTQIYKISKAIYSRVAVSVCNSFFSKQMGPLLSFFCNQRDRLNKKFAFLRSRRNAFHQKLDSIHYFCSFSSTSVNFGNLNNMKFSFEPPEPALHSDDIIDIKVDSGSFINNHYSLCDINKKWFVNLSSITIPKNVQSLLQLGENFSLPIHNNDMLTMEFIKSFENNKESFLRSINQLFGIDR